jgi:hypothetical protein
MVGHQLTRFIRNHSRFAVAWAMLPLVLLNGRTTTGCGCTGHFEAVCHCQCGDGCGGCCGQDADPSCCADKTGDRFTSNPAAPFGTSERVQGLHCTQVAEYVVVPATVAPTLADNDLHASAFVLASFSVPFQSVSTPAGLAVQLDTGPPNDFVVTLHRLVI